MRALTIKHLIAAALSCDSSNLTSQILKGPVTAEQPGVVVQTRERKLSIAKSCLLA